MSFRPHEGTVAETGRDAASDEVPACVRSTPVPKKSMSAKPWVLVFLFACHTSSPSVTSGSGTGETATMAQPEGSSAARPQQNDAPSKITPPPAPSTPVTAPANQPPASPARPPEPPGQAAAPAGAVAGPGIGENCGSGDACASGLSCVSYYGIMGMRGPQFKSCEIRCDTDKVCPNGKTCVTIADGPGRVCR